MALSKVTYVDGVTIIGAKNLNDIQDELIRQGEQQTADEELTEAALALKADKSTTYTKTEVDSALALKADKSDTYTKAQMDASLALKADKADTYTKAEVDASLELKADKSDTYTKTEVNTALALKADKSDTYTKTETYTKAQVDSAFELKADLVNEWSNNLWNGHYSGGFVNQVTGGWSPDASPTSTYCGTDEFIPVQAPFVFVVHDFTGASNIVVRYAIYDEDKQFLSGAIVNNSDYTVDQELGASYLTFTNPNAKYIRFSAVRLAFTSGNFPMEVQRGTRPNMYSKYVDGKVVDITEMSQLGKSNIVGYRPIQEKKSSSPYTNDIIRLPVNISVKKNKVYHFFANIDDNFTSMQCGHGMGDYSLYFEIDNTNLKFMSNGAVGTSIVHGLTLNTYIDLLLIVGEENTGTIILNTLGGQYKHTVQVVNGYKGMLFVKNTGSALTNVSITFACEDFRQPIWMFGDSYFTHTSEKRWTYHLINWGFGRCLLNGFPGEGSASAFNQFVDYVNLYGCPKYAVWCMGMNDVDDSAVNADWLTYVQMFIDICEANQIEPILATIPNTPTVTNYYKNEWVKNSGYRYIDFAKAVNAESIGATWYADTREDNTHPNENGAKLLALQALKDLPELMLGNI